MPKYFTLREAETVLAEVEPFVREAVSIKSSFDEAEAELQAVTDRINMTGGASIDRNKVISQRNRRDALASRLKEAIEAIHNHGCVLKDLDVGLLDFPTLFRGDEVYLCWRLGEKEIRFWHGVEEGFRGRKSIDQDFIDNHRGGSD